MFRINKQPLQTAVGTFTVLTAVLAFTGCSAGEKNTEETEPSSSEAVLYMGDDPVTEEEYALLAEKLANDISMEYTTEQVNSEAFWEKEFDGITPCDRLEEIISDELKYNYTLKQLGEELEVTEPYTFSSMMESMDEENEERSEQLDEEGEIYGLTSYDESTWYDYWYSNLETQVRNALIEDEIEVSEEECRAYYDENKSEYTYETGVDIIYAEVTDTSEDGNDTSWQTAMQIAKAMEAGCDAEELEEEFPEAYFEELALNSLDTQEGNSGIYSLRWETASSMQEGEVCSPYEQEGTYCVIKCLSREENQAVSYEDVESRIERTLQVEEASEYIRKMGEDMEIREGEISAEEVILGAVSG